jgi:hypothetical protein
MSIIQTKTVPVGEGAITFRAASGWTRTKRTTISSKLYRAFGTINPEGTHYQADDLRSEQFFVVSDLIAHTDHVTKPVGFDWPSASASAEELMTFIDCLDSLPAGQIESCRDAIDDLNAPVDPELAPMSDDQEKS